MNKLKTYRKKINKIDKEIISLLKKRFLISKKIGNIKRKNNIKIQDIKREKELIKNKINTSNLNKKFIKDIYNLIFKESRRLQK